MNQLKECEKELDMVRNQRARFGVRIRELEDALEGLQSQFQGQTFVVQNTDTEIIKNLLYEVLRRLTRIESGFQPVAKKDE